VNCGRRSSQAARLRASHVTRTVTSNRRRHKLERSVGGVRQRVLGGCTQVIDYTCGAMPSAHAARARSSAVQSLRYAVEDALRWRRHARRCTRIAGIVATAALACTTTEPRFETKYAASFDARSVRASVLGVYRDGRLSEPAWAALVPHLPAGLRTPGCGPGFGEALKVENAQVFDAIEARTKMAVVDDELLEMIAPAASADFILSFAIYEDGGHGDATQSLGRVLVAHGGPPIGSDLSAPLVTRKTPGVEMSGYLYSRSSLQTVAAVTMQFPGAGLQEAAATFGQEFGAALPPLTCGDWRWSSIEFVPELDAMGLPVERFRLLPRQR
jgi:hypothetical protein